MRFTDDESNGQRCFSEADLKQLKAAFKFSYQGYKKTEARPVLDLIARLEAAEAVLNSAKRYQYEDGLIIYEFQDIRELMEVWRKAAGK